MCTMFQPPQPTKVLQCSSNNNYCKLNPLSSRCIKASFYIPENRLNSRTARGLRKKIFMKLFYQYMTILVNLSPSSSHLNPLQVGNCDSNSRLVVDEDDNGKFRLERVKAVTAACGLYIIHTILGPSLCI